MGQRVWWEGDGGEVKRREKRRKRIKKKEAGGFSGFVDTGTGRSVGGAHWAVGVIVHQ